MATRRRGFDFWTGVPCSFLTPVINAVIGDASTGYVGAASEGEAMAIAAGAWLAGKETVVMCQNSGLGNAVNPLTSLNWPFRIPTLMLVTWRGQPGLSDEPQHELMGAITADMLDVLRVPHAPFPGDAASLEELLAQAQAQMREERLPFALIMRRGTVADEPLQQTPAPARPRGQWTDLSEGAQRPRRFDALERALEVLPPAALLIATTGKCGRELFTLSDRPQHLYQVGSMGGASAMGLGVALHTSRPVVVLDGDGAALMKLGNLATIGAHAPANLLHVVLDNGVHDSTGGQATVSAGVDFAAIACHCGFASGISVDSLPGFSHALHCALHTSGPHLIHLKIRPGSIESLGRPSIRPDEVASRFKAELPATRDGEAAGGP